MRVIFATHSFPRHEGDAAGSFLLRLARALRAIDIDVVAVAPRAAGLASREIIGDIEVRRFAYAPRRYETLAYHGRMAEDVARSWTAKGAMGSLVVAEIAAIRGAIRSTDADLVHAHWWFPSGLAASLATIGTNLPLVTTCHGSDVRLLASNTAGATLAARVFRASAVTTTVSSWLAARVRELTGTTAVVAPMPADATLFGSVAHSPATDVLFVGRLNAQKGAAHALRAFSLCTRATALTMVGEGADRDELGCLSVSLGVGDRVTWIGRLDQHELAARMANAGVVVMPSTDEGLGLVAVESLLCGTPVVGFASGGLTDVIADGRGGVLVEPGDDTALARAIDRLLADPAERARAAASGREAALATFAPDAVAARYAAIYRDALRATGERTDAR